MTQNCMRHPAIPRCIHTPNLGFLEPHRFTTDGILYFEEAFNDQPLFDKIVGILIQNSIRCDKDRQYVAVHWDMPNEPIYAEKKHSMHLNCLLITTCIGLLFSVYTVKPVLSGHTKRRPKLVFKTDYRLMQVKSIAECSKGSILQYFRHSLSYHLSLRSLFCLF